jgi:hypothetical protein
MLVTRVLGPVLPRGHLADPPPERGVRLVEEVELGRRGVLLVRLVHQAVAPVGHQVLEVGGEEPVPVHVPTLVEQRGLEEEELIDLVLQLGIDEELLGDLQKVGFGGDGHTRLLDRWWFTYGRRMVRKRAGKAGSTG